MTVAFKKKWVLKYLGISFLAGLLIMATIVFLLPLILNIIVIPKEIGDIVLLTILLTLSYFVILCIVRKFSSSRAKKIIIAILASTASTVVMVGTVYIASTLMFFQSTSVGEFDYNTYAVIVREDSKYQSITELNGETIGIMADSQEIGAIETLEKGTELSFSLVAVDGGLSELANQLLDQQVESICLEQGKSRFLDDNIDKFKDETRVLYTFKAKDKTYKTDSNVSTDSPFVVYVSGIDQYGQSDSIVGRSDVNQLIIVNPTTNKILLVNTPRDYYVQLAGTTGLKDKLTHAGIYGIETSIKTIEELYDVKIDYYIRVNFDSLIKVVDQIGGIDIVSDQAFTPYTDSSVRVQEGLNHFGGKEALAYARERYAYETGDRHRGENQQQVISAIIEKVTGSSTLLANYNNILRALQGSFQTDMSIDTIIGLFQSELSNHTNWTIETISVDGTGSMEQTYSMGAQPLYVMIPDEVTLEQARKQISQMMKTE